MLFIAGFDLFVWCLASLLFVGCSVVGLGVASRLFYALLYLLLIWWVCTVICYGWLRWVVVWCVACWGFVDLLFGLLVFSIDCLLWVMVALWFLRVGVCDSWLMIVAASACLLARYGC